MRRHSSGGHLDAGESTKGHPDERAPGRWAAALVGLLIYVGAGIAATEKGRSSDTAISGKIREVWTRRLVRGQSFRNHARRIERGWRRRAKRWRLATEGWRGRQGRASALQGGTDTKTTEENTGPHHRREVSTKETQRRPQRGRKKRWLATIEGKLEGRRGRGGCP